MYTTRSTPASAAASSTFCVAVTFTASIVARSRCHEELPYAARWKIHAGPASRTARTIAARSVRSTGTTRSESRISATRQS